MGTSTGTPAQPEAGPGKRSGREVSRDAPGDAGAGSRGPRPQVAPEGSDARWAHQEAGAMPLEKAGRTARRRRRGKQGRQAPRRWAGASAGARRGSIGRARRQALGGGKHWAAAHAIRRLAQGTHQLMRLRQGGIGPAGRGRRPPGRSGPGGRRRRGFLPGRRRPRPPHGGSPGRLRPALSTFDLVSIPAAWTPSTRPFDRDTGPSGDTARVTQSAAVCRHFPARASACHPNSRLCPTLTGAAIRRSA